MDISKYFSKEYPLMMSNKPGELPDGNALLYTSTAYVIKKFLRQDTTDDMYNFGYMVNEAWYFTEKGLLTRGPHKRMDWQSHDDYIGVCSAALMYSPVSAHYISLYGYNNWWVFKAKHFSGIKNKFRGWFYRLPGVVPHIKLCNAEQLGFFDKLWWCFDLLTTTFRGKDETSGRILDWLKIRAYRHSGQDYYLFNKTIDYWESDIAKKYKNFMGGVFAKYFNNEHPFAIAMRNKI